MPGAPTSEHASTDRTATTPPHHARTSTAVARAIITIGVTLAIKAVAAVVIASIVFDGALVFLAAGAGTVLMTFVGLPALLAATSDINEELALSAAVPESRGAAHHAVDIATTRPTRDALVPGRRVRVVRQMPHRDRCWTPAVEGTIVAYRQAPTGSWFAHSKKHKLWLDRLELRHDDGEFTDCILDGYTRVEILDDVSPASAPDFARNGHAPNRRAHPRRREFAHAVAGRTGCTPAPRRRSNVVI